MLTWFKNIFGVTPKREEAFVLTQELRIEETAKPKTTTTKTAPKKSTTKKAPVETTEAPKKRGRKPKAAS